MKMLITFFLSFFFYRLGQ